MKTTRKYIEAMAGAISQSAGVTVQEGKNWMTDIRKRVIEYDTQDLLNSDPLVAKGLILHELGHLSYTTDSTTELGKKFSDMQGVYNAYEDMRIEEKMRDQFEGFASQAFDSIHVTGVEKQLKASKDERYPALGKILTLQLSYNAYVTSGNYEAKKRLSEARNIIYNSLTPEERQIYKQIPENLIDKVSDLKDTQEVKDLIDKELYPIIKDYIGNQEKGNYDPHKSLVTENTNQTNPSLISLPSDSELKALLDPYIRTVAGKLTDILKETQATRFEGQHFSGKLLSRNAYKVLTGEDRIFSKKNTPNKPNYVITLVLDESGSMDGERAKQTYIAATLISEISKKMGFKTNVIIYDSEVRTGEVIEYRNIRGGGNDDLRAMQEVQNITFKSDDNIVFVLTDGGVCRDPRPVLDNLYKDGYIVTAVAVGLNEEYTEQLRTFYKHTIEAPDVEKLPTIMIQQLQKLIHR